MVTHIENKKQRQGSKQQNSQRKVLSSIIIFLNGHHKINEINKTVNLKNDPFSQVHYQTLLFHFSSSCCLLLQTAIFLHASLNSSFTLSFHNYSLPCALALHHSHPSFNFSLTLDWTSALWSFWSSSAADLVSSLRAAMCRAGRRTLPLVSCSNSRETTELWPCWREIASGVKPSWRSRGEEHKKSKSERPIPIQRKREEDVNVN